MSPTPPRKKLIEVVLPLEAINKPWAREKSIGDGHAWEAPSSVIGAKKAGSGVK
jgi:hypothetical protein